MEGQEVPYVRFTTGELHDQPHAPHHDTREDEPAPYLLDSLNALVFCLGDFVHERAVYESTTCRKPSRYGCGVNLLIPLLAALAATGFAIDLGIAWRRRPRPHAGMWALAMGAYALASWALVLGLGFGWGALSFRLFYWLGAIVNIPFLAAGSVFLVLGAVAGRRFAYGVGVWSLLGAAATWLAPLKGATETDGIPEGKELFDFIIEVGGASVPGPRLFAAFAGGVATLIIVGLAGYSAIKFWRSNRRLAVGNWLIVAGTVAPALGGSLTALGEAAGFAFALLLGAMLLWAGYTVATRSRSPESLPIAAELRQSD